MLNREAVKTVKSDDPLINRLREEIGPDVGVVRPLARAPWRALWLLLICLISVCAVLTIFGFRANYEVLGPFWFWGLPAVQMIGACVVFAAGLKQAIPGSALPRLVLYAGGGMALGLHFTVSLAAFRLAPLWPPEGSEGRAALTCLTTIVVLTVLPAVAGVLLARKGLPVDPLLTGTLLGLAGGLVGEAAWRMHCPVTSFGHVGPAHTGAVLLAILGGFLVGRFWRWSAASALRAE